MPSRSLTTLERSQDDAFPSILFPRGFGFETIFQRQAASPLRTSTIFSTTIVGGAVPTSAPASSSITTSNPTSSTSPSNGVSGGSESHSDPNQGHPAGSHLAIIVGVALGAFIFAFLLVLPLLWRFWKKRKAKKRDYRIEMETIRSSAELLAREQEKNAILVREIARTTSPESQQTGADYDQTTLHHSGSGGHSSGSGRYSGLHDDRYNEIRSSPPQAHTPFTRRMSPKVAELSPGLWNDAIRSSTEQKWALETSDRAQMMKEKRRNAEKGLASESSVLSEYPDTNIWDSSSRRGHDSYGLTTNPTSTARSPYGSYMYHTTDAGRGDTGRPAVRGNLPANYEPSLVHRSASFNLRAQREREDPEARPQYPGSPRLRRKKSEQGKPVVDKIKPTIRIETPPPRPSSASTSENIGRRVPSIAGSTFADSVFPVSEVSDAFDPNAHRGPDQLHRRDEYNRRPNSPSQVTGKGKGKAREMPIEVESHADDRQQTKPGPRDDDEISILRPLTYSPPKKVGPGPSHQTNMNVSAAKDAKSLPVPSDRRATETQSPSFTVFSEDVYDVGSNFDSLHYSAVLPRDEDFVRRQK